MRSLPVLVTAALCAAPDLQAQDLLAEESFDYVAGSPIHDLAGGTGFLEPWWSFDAAGSGSQITTPGIDGVGEKATTVLDGVGAWRRLDTEAHIHLTDENLEYGVDDSEYWVSFDAVRSSGSDDMWGGFSLTIWLTGEQLFLGSPYQTGEWGLERVGGTAVTVAGSSVDAAARLVYLIEFLPGDEHVQMWIDPPVDHPDPAVTPPDLDVMVADFTFNEVRIASGGSTTQTGFDFDGITLEGQANFPVLTVENLVAGQTADFTVSGAGAGNDVVIAYSQTGPGPTNTPFGPVDLSTPINQLPTVVADASGVATLSQPIPPNASGVDVWMQAVELTGGGAGNLSNSLALQVQ